MPSTEAQLPRLCLKQQQQQRETTKDEVPGPCEGEGCPGVGGRATACWGRPLPRRCRPRAPDAGR